MAIDEPTAESPEAKTVQDREISAAESKGLLVDTSSTQKKTSPVSVVTETRDSLSSPAHEMKELDQWEQKRVASPLVWADVDSDDDLI
jgi:hypothetical protein